MFAGQVRIVSHSSCRTSAILKYFFPLSYSLYTCRLSECQDLLRKEKEETKKAIER